MPSLHSLAPAISHPLSGFKDQTNFNTAYNKDSNMEKRLGVAPEMAIAGLTLIVVGSSAVVYQVTDSSIQNTGENQKVDVNVKDLNPESCWKQGSETYMSIRNTGTERANISKADIIIRGQTLDDSDYNLDKDIVSSEGTFTINTTVEVFRDTKIKLTTGAQRVAFFCEGLPESSGSGSGPSSIYVPEVGGSISSLQLEGNLTYGGTNLCIGESCSFSTGGSPSSEDSDDVVSRSGDVMTGSLNTSTVITTGRMCIGNDCTERPGSLDGWVTDSQNTMDGFLRTDTVTYQSWEDGCVGSNC